MQIAKVIALLMPDSMSHDDTSELDLNQATAQPTALIRDADGKMKLEVVESAAQDRDFADQMRDTGCFRRGKPIVDPVTRQVVGYELEMISDPLDGPFMAPWLAKRERAAA